MVINLPPDLAEYVSRQLAKGRYKSEDELLCEAVRQLQWQDHPSLEGVSPYETDYVLETKEELERFLDEIDTEVDRERSLEK